MYTFGQQQNNPAWLSGYTDDLAERLARIEDDKAKFNASLDLETVPTQKRAPDPKSKWESAATGLGDAIDSWNKGNWAMEEENNRRHSQGVANTVSLLQMIPGIYESRNNARKATYGLAGMAGV